MAGLLGPGETITPHPGGVTHEVVLRLEGSEVLEHALNDHQETWRRYRAALDENERLRVELEALQVRYEGNKLGEGPCAKN